MYKNTKKKKYKKSGQQILIGREVSGNPEGGESYNEQERNAQKDVKKYKIRKIQKNKRRRLADTISNYWNLSDWQF